MSNINEVIDEMVNTVKRRLYESGISEHYSKFLIVTGIELPDTPQYFNRMKYVFDKNANDNIYVLPVTLAYKTELPIEDCTPEIESTYDEIILKGMTKILVKYVHNITQEIKSSLNSDKNTFEVGSRISIKYPYLCMRQAISELENISGE